MTTTQPTRRYLVFRPGKKQHLCVYEARDAKHAVQIARQLFVMPRGTPAGLRQCNRASSRGGIHRNRFNTPPARERTNHMKSKPILFSAPMVRAILAGTKTQTRRVVKPQPVDGARVGFSAFSKGYGPDFVEARRYEHEGGSHQSFIRCPFGGPSDRLWVKETWAAPHACDHLKPSEMPDDTRIHYAADGSLGGLLTRPSLFMQQRFSRIDLEVTAVRVERLQDISEEDARKEGVERDDGAWASYSPILNRCSSARKSYSTLWQSINGPGSWDENPWVWVIEFSRKPTTTTP